ncbi:ArnT family glycosyltransferase [Patescibacteria group bacterium]
MKVTNRKVFLIVILLIAALMRLWKLGIIPRGITNDELGYMYNAYSIATTGNNIFGQKFPIFSWIAIYGFPFMPVTTYLMVPFVYLLGLSEFSGRILSAALGIADIYLIYLLVVNLLKNKKIALLSAAMLAVNPWHVFLSRTAYDPNVSLFFFLLSITAFSVEIPKKKLPIISSVSLFLAIFAYRGMNPLILGIVSICLWLGKKVFKINKSQLKFYFVSIVVIVITFVSTAYIFKDKGYVKESVADIQKIENFINIQSRESRSTLFLSRLFLNKPNIIIKKYLQNYISGYSPNMLFLNGEENQVYSMWDHGKFYILDIVFIIIGFLYLPTLKNHTKWFFIILPFAAGIPGLVGGAPFAARNYFLSVSMCILAGSGIYIFIKSINRNLFKLVASFVIIALYTYLLFGFLHDYTYRYSYQRQENWFKSAKDLSKYLKKNKNNFDKAIVIPGSWGDAQQYAFHNRLNPILIQDAWKNKLESSNAAQILDIDGVTFNSSCQKLNTSTENNLYAVHESCKQKLAPASSFKDFYGNDVWLIYKTKLPN